MVRSGGKGREKQAREPERTNPCGTDLSEFFSKLRHLSVRHRRDSDNPKNTSHPSTRFTDHSEVQEGRTTTRLVEGRARRNFRKSRSPRESCRDVDSSRVCLRPPSLSLEVWNSNRLRRRPCPTRTMDYLCASQTCRFRIPAEDRDRMSSSTPSQARCSIPLLWDLSGESSTQRGGPRDTQRRARQSCSLIKSRGSSTRSVLLLSSWGVA